VKTQPVFKSPQGREAILACYELILQRWPVPYQARMLTTRWGETFALDCGAAADPPLVLLHGSASNSAMWVGDAAVFCARHGGRFRLIALDLPGEPGKSEPVRFSLDGPACLEWMHDVLAALGLERVTLLGISLGGWVALKFATACPERVEKLALLCPSGVAPEKIDFYLRAIPFFFLGQWGAGQVLRMLNAGQPLHPETVRFTYIIGRNFNPRRHGGPLFSDEELSRLAMPVLLLAGEKDILQDPFATAARLQRLLPCFTADVLPGAGHILANTAGRVMPFLDAGSQARS
jgi:pimeloyl-ACP methyl ester carboxylesterase